MSGVPLEWRSMEEGVKDTGPQKVMMSIQSKEMGRSKSCSGEMQEYWVLPIENVAPTLHPLSYVS